MNLARGKGRTQEVTGRTVIIPGNSFFGVKEVYKESDGEENKKKSQIEKFLISFAHMLTNKYTKKIP